MIKNDINMMIEIVSFISDLIILGKTFIWFVPSVS